MQMNSLLDLKSLKWTQLHIEIVQYIGSMTIWVDTLFDLISKHKSNLSEENYVQRSLTEICISHFQNIPGRKRAILKTK